MNPITETEQKINTGVDIRFTHTEEILLALKKYAAKHGYELRAFGMEQEDFVQDVMVAILRRQGLDRYDPSKITRGGLESLIFSIASRFFIDIKRARFAAARCDVEGKPLSFISTDQKIGEGKDGDEVTLGSFISAPEDMGRAVMDLEEMVTDERISPNYNLTWKGLLRMTTKFSAEEIAVKVGISTSRVVGLQSELRRRIKF